MTSGKYYDIITLYVYFIFKTNVFVFAQKHKNLLPTNLCFVTD